MMLVKTKMFSKLQNDKYHVLTTYNKIAYEKTTIKRLGHFKKISLKHNIKSKRTTLITSSSCIYCYA